MQCQNCKQYAATVHLTEISDGHRTELHLCQLCAQQQGIAVKTKVPLNALLSTLLAVQNQTEDQAAEPAGKQSELSCPVCGMTAEKLRKGSLLGCPLDYEVFGDFLKPVIENAHKGGSTHCGKVPGHAPEDAKKQIEIANLKKQIDLAVKNEDYETAARLRDKIQQITK